MNRILSDWGEKGWFQKLQQFFPVSDPAVKQGIGDDAAVLKLGKTFLLGTTDALQEGIHFDWKWMDGYSLGWKSLAVNVSDIAAMGGNPRWGLLSITIPREESLERVNEFLRGAQACARKFGITLIGGDTDADSTWRVSWSLLGEGSKTVLRSTAQVGDEIWITGFPGRSGLGLELLKKGKPEKKWSTILKHHLQPTPRVQAGETVSKLSLASSLMDVSDGVWIDLEKICHASKVGANIFIERFSPDLIAEKIAKEQKINWENLVLSGGEDYELLFTAHPKKSKKIREKFKELKLPVTCIGEIVSSPKSVKGWKNGKNISPIHKGFEHF